MAYLVEECAMLASLGEASDLIHDRLDMLRGEAWATPATLLAGVQAKAVFLWVDMLIECSRKSGMQFDGTAQEQLWDFLGEPTKGGAA